MALQKSPFRRSVARLLAAALAAGLLGCLPLQAAAAPRASAVRAADATTADEAFVAARQAMLQDNADRFAQLAPRTAGHPLAAYIDYWALRLRLNDKKLDAAPGSLDSDVDRFIAANPGTVVADLARRDWMLNLGRRGEFARLDAQFAQWQLQDDGQVSCYRLASRAQNGEKVADAARELLAQTRDLGAACGTLVEVLVRAAQFDRDDLARTLRGAMEFNSAASLRRVGTLMSLDPDRLDAALDRPMRAVLAPAGRELDMIGLSRLARQDTRAAVERLSLLAGAGSAMTAQDKAFVMAQVAAASMRKLEPEALGYARDGLKADASDETWVWLARAALRGQDWKTLMAVTARMSPATRRDPAWVYWQARALNATGKPAEGEALLRSIAGQFHFYGQLADEELGQPSNPPPRPVAGITEIEVTSNDRNAGFERALQFYALGLRFEGNREWNWQLRGMNDRQLLAAAEWACRRKVLDRCVNTADRTVAEHDFTLRFISPFLEQLKPVAAGMNLDIAWVYGLIRQESRFIMDARSTVGAQGLMQMMPATGRWVARKLGVTDFRTEQLNELDTNLRFGTFYLKSVYDDLEGSPVMASAAYNAGPNRPRNWRATLPGTVEGAVFAEIIPFNETRDYVKKVLSNATYYAALFSGQPQSLKQRLGTVAPKVQAPSALP